MREILLSLPVPDPELASVSSRAGAGLTTDELSALLTRVWNRRQAELQGFMQDLRTEAQQMHALLGELAGGASAQGVASAGSGTGAITGTGSAMGPAVTALGSLEAQLAVLEDLEMHVAQLHNAEDFSAMGGVGDMVRLLHQAEAQAEGAREGAEAEAADRLAAHAAWVLGTACKYAPAPQAAAVAAGAPAALARILRRVADALSAAVAPNAAASGLTVASAAGRRQLLLLGGKAVYAVGALARGSQPGTLTALVNATALARVAAIVRAASVALDTPPPMAGAATPLASGEMLPARALCAKSMALLSDLVVEAAAPAEDATSRATRDAATVDGVPLTVLESRGSSEPAVQQQQGLGGAADAEAVTAAGAGGSSTSASAASSLPVLCAIAEAAWPGTLASATAPPCHSALPATVSTSALVEDSVSRSLEDAAAVLRSACRALE